MFLKTTSYISALLLTLTLTGCYSPKPQETAPLFTVPGKFSKTGQTNVQTKKWWQDFNDPQLNKLIKSGLENNFSLQATFHRLEQAKASCAGSSSDLLPSFGTENKFTTSRNRVDDTTSSSQSFSLGLGASYEIDLWGRISSLIDAAELDMLGSEMDLETAAITLSSQIASQWYQLSEQRNRLELLKQQYSINTKALEIIKLQFRTGKIGIEDVLQQQQLLERNKADQANLNIDIDRSFHKLNILIGKPPGEMGYIPSSGKLVALPPLPATGLPMELLQRRPDVQAAYYAVKRANSRLAAAIAAQYPALSISAKINTTGASASDLFNDWLSNLAGNIVAPLFDGGSRTAEVKRQEAVTKEKLKLYNQTMLEALGEVEDALKQEEELQDYIKHIDSQLALATRSMEQIKNRYLKGSENYQRVLSALVSMQNLKQSQLKARQSLLNNRIELCRSLAGGWKISNQMNDYESK